MAVKLASAEGQLTSGAVTNDAMSASFAKLADLFVNLLRRRHVMLAVKASSTLDSFGFEGLIPEQTVAMKQALLEDSTLWLDTVNMVFRQAVSKSAVLKQHLSGHMDKWFLKEMELVALMFKRSANFFIGWNLVVTFSGQEDKQTDLMNACIKCIEDSDAIEILMESLDKGAESDAKLRSQVLKEMNFSCMKSSVSKGITLPKERAVKLQSVAVKEMHEGFVKVKAGNDEFMAEDELDLSNMSEISLPKQDAGRLYDRVQILMKCKPSFVTSLLVEQWLLASVSFMISDLTGKVAFKYAVWVAWQTGSASPIGVQNVSSLQVAPNVVGTQAANLRLGHPVWMLPASCLSTLRVVPAWHRHSFQQPNHIISRV